MKIRLRIEKGRAVGIYSDALVPYLDKMPGHVLSRASHVEPDNEHLHGGNWVVDMAPVQGGVHYKDEQGQPFSLRAEALAFEVRELSRLLKLGGDKDAGTHTEGPRRAELLCNAGRST